ncbi:NLRC3 [Symbiodinium sp. CCMP2592]|nr:NLRC3 [Symbiodinium sp. CCMP2592]
MPQAQYCLTDPGSLAQYLEHANIRLVRAKYLYELVQSKRTLPRRQEAEEWGLVTHEEVRAWAAGTRDAMICSVSHAWESREHPDPCAHQLKCLVDVVSLFDAAYFSDVWLFYDYVSLFQFKRESPAEEESFRRSMQDMHVLYAHQCTRTFRIESLTPDDVWDAALANSEYRVKVYDEATASVRDRPLKELYGNREVYRNRGWCKAEVEWSLARSRSEQNHWIDAPALQSCSAPELLGKVPMAPEIFAEEMNSAAFTHRSDAEEVKRLQFKVFLQKASGCEEALFEYLPEGQLGQLAKVLPYYEKLRVLRLRNFKVGRAEAEEFGKALASNKTIRELEIRIGKEHEYGFLWEAIGEALKCNFTLTSIDLNNNSIGVPEVATFEHSDPQGVEGGKAIGEALKTNSTLTEISLLGNRIGDEGVKAIGEALKTNSTLTSINLRGNCIGGEADKAIGEALKTNSTLTSINLKGNRIGDEGVKAICEALKCNSTLTEINLEHNWIGISGGKARWAADGSVLLAQGYFPTGAISEALKTNSTLTSIDLKGNFIGNEGVKAIGEALKTNSTLRSIKLYRNNSIEQVLAQRKDLLAGSAEAAEAGKARTGRVRIKDLAKKLNQHCNLGELGIFCDMGDGPDFAEAISEVLKSSCTLTSIDLRGSHIGDEGGKAIGEALKTNSTLTSIILYENHIGDEGMKAIGEALKTNCTLTSINLACSHIGDEGGKAIGEVLKTNSTLTSIDLRGSHIGDEGGKAIGEVLKTNSTLTSIDLQAATSAMRAIGEALKTNSTLTSINLDGNRIGDEGVKALAESLKSNTTVCEIYLELNNVSTECEEARVVRSSSALAEALSSEGTRKSHWGQVCLVVKTLYGEASNIVEPLSEDAGLDEDQCFWRDWGTSDLLHEALRSLKVLEAIQRWTLSSAAKSGDFGRGMVLGGWAVQKPQAQYGLTDPKSLAEHLEHANIRLVRAEYLYELAKSRRTLPRRQEAEEWGLVTHAEVGAWAAGTRDAMICSVSHAWESREHPDPCAHQLKCLVDVVSLFDAAYFSDIWLFYDYVSLFQFKREGQAEEESFRRSMQDMHVLYAHQCTRTFRIESLTPNNVWNAALANPEYRVKVYDAASTSVRDRPLKELVANRVLYGTRGWCKAEVEWSSARSRSEQNHWIDAPVSQQSNEEECKEPEMLGKVPMAPEIFAEEMNSAAFTHRSDAEEVKKLQFKVFLQKVSGFEEALFERLPFGQLGRLAKALPYYEKLRALRLRDCEVGRAEAEEFAKALASNKTIREVEIRFGYEHEHGFLWEVIGEALKTNSTLTSINLESSQIGVEGVKAMNEALKANSTLTSINLGWNLIGVEGCKAICEALKCNSTLTSINLESNSIRVEGGKAIGEALKTNSTLRSINLQANGIGGEGGKAIGEALKSNSTLTSMQLAFNRIGNEGGKAIGEALKSNSTLTSINLEGNDISEQVLAEMRKRCLLVDSWSAEAASAAAAPEAGKAWTGRARIGALAERLNVHCNPSKLSFERCGLYGADVVKKAISEALKTNSTLTSINLAVCYIGDEGAEVIREALKNNSRLTSINLASNSIGDEGGKAVGEALKSNSTLTSINLQSNRIGVEGGKAIGEALRTNSTLTSVNLEFNRIGDEGVKARWCQGLAQAEGSGHQHWPPLSSRFPARPLPRL